MRGSKLAADSGALESETMEIIIARAAVARAIKKCGPVRAVEVADQADQADQAD